MHCPKCDADISDTYEGADPSVGIMSGGYYCDACDEAVGDEDREPMEDDVNPFARSHTSSELESKSSNGCCQHCQTPLEAGYGLAGGGIGPYMYCPAEHCGKTFIKSKDVE